MRFPKSTILSAVAAIILGTVVLADGENVGVGYYFIRHDKWQCDASINALKDLRVANASILWQTPGGQNQCAGKLVTLPNFKRLTIHVFNQVCVRNQRCAAYETFAGLTTGELDKKLINNDAVLYEKMRTILNQVAGFVAGLPPHVTCYVNPLLEHNQSPAALKAINDFTRSIIGPRCEIITNPVGNNANKQLAGGDVLELHGSNPKLKAPCSSNLDGETIDFHAANAFAPNALPEDEVQSYLDRYSHCIGADLWISEFNCIAPGPFVHPRGRTNCADAKRFNLVAKHVKESQALAVLVPPWDIEDNASKKGCTKIVKTADGSGGFLFKQSDVHPGAVALFPGRFKNKFNSVKVLKKGRIFELLSYGGVGNPDTAGNRQTWRSKTPAKKYPFNVVINADNICWVVKNTRVRND